MATAPLTQTTGRRKEAVAGARSRPGTGVLTVNGRAVRPRTSRRRPIAWKPSSRCGSCSTPPSATMSTPPIHGGGVSGQAGAMRMALAPAPSPSSYRDPHHPEEGRPAHPRLTEEGEQEVRPRQGPQGQAVHEAVIVLGQLASLANQRRVLSWSGSAAPLSAAGRASSPDPPRRGCYRPLPHPQQRPRVERLATELVVKFGTDGVRGVANSDLTASFALDLGRAAAHVLAPATAVRGRRRR